MRKERIFIALRKYMLPLTLAIVAISVLGFGFLVTNGSLNKPTANQETVPLTAEKATQAFDTCLQTTDVPLKVSCWTEFIEQKMYSEGLEKTFEVFTQIYKADPDFVAQGCHGAVHSIGEIAYDFYKSGGQIKFSQDASACGYGFYHGFLGKLLHEKPDMEDAVKFCSSLRGEADEYDYIAYKTCFHGIGHGMVEEEPLAEYYWGNVDGLLVPALKICGTLPEAFQQRECADGAFNGLNKFMSNDLYGFTYNTADPFAWCDVFKDNRINYVSCHFETAQSFTSEKIITDDATAVLPYVEGLDPELQIMIIDIAVGNMMQSDIVRDDNSDYFRQCSAFPNAELERACLSGIVGGFFSYGEPGSEKNKTEAFCNSPSATQDQQTLCQELMASYIQ